MTIEISCAMCGRATAINIIMTKITAESSIGSLIPTQWVRQQNGDNFDIYCSKACAA